MDIEDQINIVPGAVVPYSLCQDVSLVRVRDVVRGDDGEIDEVLYDRLPIKSWDPDVQPLRERDRLFRERAVNGLRAFESLASIYQGGEDNDMSESFRVIRRCAISMLRGAPLPARDFPDVALVQMYVTANSTATADRIAGVLPAGSFSLVDEGDDRAKFLVSVVGVEAANRVLGFRLLGRDEPLFRLSGFPFGACPHKDVLLNLRIGGLPDVVGKILPAGGKVLEIECRATKEDPENGFQIVDPPDETETFWSVYVRVRQSDDFFPAVWIADFEDQETAREFSLRLSEAFDDVPASFPGQDCVTEPSCARAGP